MDAPHRPDSAERFARLLVRSRGRAVVVVLLCLVVATLALLHGRRIKIDANLEALLADEAPSVVALTHLRARQGSTDLLNIAIKSDDPEANRRLVEDVAARMRTWEEVVELDIDRDYTPIRDHALYFLDLPDLEQLRDRLKREKQKAIGRRLSVTGDFNEDAIVGEDWDATGDEEPAEGDAPVDEPVAADAQQPPPEDIRALLERQREELAASGRVSEADLDVIWPHENEAGEIVWADRVGRPIASRDGTVWLVQARLTRPATDIQYSTKLAEKVDALFEELDVASYAPGMLAKIGGAYSTSGEARAIIKDLNASTWVAAALVVACLVFGFANLRGLVIVLVPLAVAVLMTVSLARTLLGELNVLTAFLFAVLLGIGVDFAIHLYVQRENQGPIADWGHVVREHFRPMLWSMLTTFGSFLLLLLADFQGFQEFGMIAAVGVLVAFTVAFVMVPALDVMLGPMRKGKAKEFVADPTIVDRPYRWPLLRWGILGAVIVLGIVGSPRVEFERDMRELRSPKSEAEEGISYKKALADTEETGTPVVLLADSPAQLEHAVDILRARAGEEMIPGQERLWIKRIISLGSHMPTDQEAKRPILAEIEELARTFRLELPRLAADAPAQRYVTHLRALERMAGAEPLTPDMLPEWAKRLFREHDGTLGRIGLVYVDVGGYDLEEVTYVTRRFRELLADTGVEAASTRFILGDLTMEVEHDAGRLPPLALLLILVLVAIDMRKIVPTFATFAALCGGLLLTFGTMGVWPIRINFYNLVVMPAVVGLGIDASIHLWHSRRLGSIASTSKAALLSALTTAGGFAGLLVAEHAGLRSIGLLGVIATLACVVISVVALGWPRARQR